MAVIMYYTVVSIGFVSHAILWLLGNGNASREKRNEATNNEHFSGVIGSKNLQIKSRKRKLTYHVKHKLETTIK